MTAFVTFVKARHLPMMLAGAAALVVLATIFSGTVASVPQLRGPELRTGTVTLMGVALGALGGLVSHSAALEIERRTVRRRSVLETVLYVAVGLLLIVIALAVGRGLSPASGGVAVRNAGGIFGLVYLLVVWCGPDRAVVLSGLYLGASTFLAADPARRVAIWSWFLAPGGEPAATWVAALCLVAGLASALLKPVADDLSAEPVWDEGRVARSR